MRDVARQKTKGEKVWNAILERTLNLPGAKVNRDLFLANCLKLYVSDSKVAHAIETGPVIAGVEPRTVARIAEKIIESHRVKVSGLSFLTSLPPGPLQLGATPADLIQFFWHCIVVAQKLAYLYGWAELFEDTSNIHEETLHIFTLFVGVMFGSQLANTALTQMSVVFTKEIAKKLPRKAITTFAVYKLSKQVAKWIGIRLTKRHFAKLTARLIPVIGGLFSGTLSWVTFSQMSGKLHTHLKRTSLPQT